MFDVLRLSQNFKVNDSLKTLPISGIVDKFEATKKFSRNDEVECEFVFLLTKYLGITPPKSI